MAKKRSEFNQLLEMECGEIPPYTGKFWEYFDANPEVWVLIRDIAKAKLSQGRRFGMKQIFERIRFGYPGMAATDPDGTGLRLPNNYTAYYARLLVFVRPDMGDLLVLRQLHPNGGHRGGKPLPFNKTKTDAVGARVVYLWQHGTWPEEE